MHEMSEFLHFSEHRLQEMALGFMALVYVIRIAWFLRFKAGRERQATTARSERAVTRGVLYSWANIAMPWAMESTRTKPYLYAQFVWFHLGVTAAIGLSFVIPYWPWILEIAGVVPVLQVIIGGAFLVGVIRIVRRVRDPYMRAISAPDDHFSLWLLTVWFFFAFLSVPNSTSMGEWHLLTYFILTAFFLVYVPFSKISHYLYYPSRGTTSGRPSGTEASSPWLEAGRTGSPEKG
jgi:nitrate reductase gamma subunit